MGAKSHQSTVEQPTLENKTGPPLEPPDAGELGKEGETVTAAVIRIERSMPEEAWVTAQEFCGCIAGHDCCARPDHQRR